jgi:ABC-2 type transport system ATP-binding protein
MSVALALRGLTKNYGSVAALKEVSLDVATGEIFGLIGPNGAGKTTLLECVLGLCQPDAGTVVVQGVDLRLQPAAAREKLGAQLQTSALPNAMTPRQALRLCGSFYAQAAAPDDLLRRFQLTEKADARFSSLSGGQRQRLALALAFVNDPDLVILDEPTAGLDPPARRELHALIAAQRAAGRTIVFSTHYLAEARALCDRVAFLDRGVLVALDSPDALIARSGALTRIILRTNPGLERLALEALPGVRRVTPAGGSRDGTWAVETTALNRTITALGPLVESQRANLLDLQIQRPTLDDVFAELTGGRT